MNTSNLSFKSRPVSDTNELYQILILFLFVALYIYNVSRYFWTFPAPSDPLQYLGPVSWGSTWAYWPWLDRINLAVNLRLFTMFFSKAYVGAMVYIGSINTLILVLSMLWAYRKSGFFAALLTGVFFNTSYIFLGWSTYIYPDQTVAFYGLLAFVIFFWDESTAWKPWRFILAGMIAGFACFTKATGVIIPIFLGFYCIYQKNWKNLIRLSAGVAGGSIIVLFLFVILFNWQSLVNAYGQFFGSSVSRNIVTGGGGTTSFGVAYYHELILSLKYFPGIGLLVLAGAYVNKNSRGLFILAWFNILFVSIVRMLAPSIPNYIYLAFVLIIPGVAIYISDSVQTREFNSIEKGNIFLYTALSIGSGILVFLGLKLGIKYSSVDQFDYAYSYLKPLDIFSGGNFEYPGYIKRLFTFSPFIIFGSLILVLSRKSSTSLVTFSLIISFLLSFMNGGLAYRKAEFDRKEAGFFYDKAQILNKVPAKTFTVYVEEWNKTRYSHQIMWVYRLFFDEKFQREFTPSYKSQYLNEYLVNSNIAYVNNEKNLVHEIKGDTILTDSYSVVSRNFPNAKVIEGINPDSGLILLELHDNFEKVEQFKYELDLGSWRGKTNPVDMDDIEMVMPPLKNAGYRGSFNLAWINFPENRIRISLDTPHPSEASVLMIGYYIENAEISWDSESFITVSAEINANSPGESNLFIQDQVDGNWDKNTVTMDIDGTKAYSVSKMLRPGFAPCITGIYFAPVKEGAWIEIKKLTISIWSKEFRK